MIIREACPACGSKRDQKTGHTRPGNQNHYCKACERQCSGGADTTIIPHEQRTLMAHLLRERLALRGICRAVGVRLPWLLHFMVECFAACPAHLPVQLPSHPSDVWRHQLAVEAAAAWSFVEKKAKKPWIGLAMDAKSRQIIALHVGDRRRDSAQALWANIPAVYQHHARFPTDP
jgi:insertion element IS1 protein InsB